MSALIDTNVLIYDTFEDSASHKEARARLDSLTEWYIPSIVFHEYVWFMRGERVDLGFAKDKVIEYATNRKTIMAAVAPDDVLFAVEHIGTYADYNDLIITSIARRLSQPLLTFDGRMMRRAEQHGVHVVRI